MGLLIPFRTLMTEPKPDPKPEPKPINIDSKISVNDNDGDVTGTKVGGDATNQNNLSMNFGSSDLDRYSNRELQMMIVNAMERSNHSAQSLEVRYYEIKKAFERQVRDDYEERKERQRETDQHRTQLDERINKIQESIDKKTETIHETIREKILEKIDKIEMWILVLVIVVGLIVFFLILSVFLFIAFRASLTVVFPWIYLLEPSLLQ